MSGTADRRRGQGANGRLVSPGLWTNDSEAVFLAQHLQPHALQPGRSRSTASASVPASAPAAPAAASTDRVGPRNGATNGTGAPAPNRVQAGTSPPTAVAETTTTPASAAHSEAATAAVTEPPDAADSRSLHPHPLRPFIVATGLDSGPSPSLANAQRLEEHEQPTDDTNTTTDDDDDDDDDEMEALLSPTRAPMPNRHTALWREPNRLGRPSHQRPHDTDSGNGNGNGNASTTSTASTPVLTNNQNEPERTKNASRNLLHLSPRRVSVDPSVATGLPRQRKKDRQNQRRRRRRRSRSDDQPASQNSNRLNNHGSGPDGGLEKRVSSHTHRRNNSNLGPANCNGNTQSRNENDQSTLLSAWRYSCFFCLCCYHSLFSRSTTNRHNARRCCDRTVIRSTLSVMGILAKIVLWGSILALCAGVVWYSYELKNLGTDPHLIAWFSAGAFVLLGFPISMYGIISHLANYNQPTVQCYVVRILWMVPIYSIESWLCLRFHRYAIYIETLRDCYESYVLYSFLQFLIEVLGGEEALILMLKDKSPTRGVHMWGLQWCVKPWLMGQPVRKTYQPSSDDTTNEIRNGDFYINDIRESVGNAATIATASASVNSKWRKFYTDRTGQQSSSNMTTTSRASASQSSSRALKRVHWKSPFFVYCKFGVLQYVLLKFVCSIVVMILERNDVYKEGDFTPKGGYLYICILTNLSQCWALYCLIFFYYATKTELGPIRPVGKFLSVKALVFFTWWQSVCISILYQMGFIADYRSSSSHGLGTGGADPSSTILTPTDYDVTNGPISETAALALDQQGGMAIGHGPTEWSSEDVAKGIQDYLICIEMFIAAIVHTFVFPHQEYSVEAVEARTRALNQTPHMHWHKRLGRKWKDWDSSSGYSFGTLSTTSGQNQHNQLLPLFSSAADSRGHKPLCEQSAPDNEVELTSRYRCDSINEDDYLMNHPMDALHDSQQQQYQQGSLSDSRNNPIGSLDNLLSLPADNTRHNPDVDSCYSGTEEFVSIASSSYQSNRVDYESDDSSVSTEDGMDDIPLMPAVEKPNFVRALLDSTIPQDLRDNTVGIIKGDYIVERKTLLHHAATSDSYDLFSRVNALRRVTPRKPQSADAGKSDDRHVL